MNTIQTSENKSAVDNKMQSLPLNTKDLILKNNCSNSPSRQRK